MNQHCMTCCCRRTSAATESDRLVYSEEDRGLDETSRLIGRSTEKSHKIRAANDTIAFLKDRGDYRIESVVEFLA